MVRPLTEREIVERVVEIVKKHLPRCGLYLFGLRARGKAKERSDFDFAVECEDKITEEVEEFPTLTCFEKLILSLKRELQNLAGERG
ncbi:nucleotidyltransferase domain-containing protein [Thermovibrio sp.]